MHCCTLNSGTASGHLKDQENPLACKLRGNSAWKICLLLFLIFTTVYLPGQSSGHLYMAFQLLQNQASGHIKVKKGTGHAIYMATPSQTNESVGCQFVLAWVQRISNFGSSAYIILNLKVL